MPPPAVRRWWTRAPTACVHPDAERDQGLHEVAAQAGIAEQSVGIDTQDGGGKCAVGEVVFRRLGEPRERSAGRQPIGNRLDHPELVQDVAVADRRRLGRFRHCSGGGGVTSTAGT